MEFCLTFFEKMNIDDKHGQLTTLIVSVFSPSHYLNSLHPVGLWIQLYDFGWPLGCLQSDLNRGLKSAHTTELVWCCSSAIAQQMCLGLAFWRMTQVDRNLVALIVPSSMNQPKANPPEIHERSSQDQKHLATDLWTHSGIHGHSSKPLNCEGVCYTVLL